MVELNIVLNFSQLMCCKNEKKEWMSLHMSWNERMDEWMLGAMDCIVVWPVTVFSRATLSQSPLHAESSAIGRNAKVNQVIHVVVVITHPQVIVIMGLHCGCIRRGWGLHWLWM
jgi:hypothetical protein